MQDRVTLRMLVRSALVSIVVYIAVVLIGVLVVGGLASRALHVGPQALTLLFTGTSVLARLVAMFTAGFIFGRQPAGDRNRNMVLAGLVSALFLLLFDILWLVPTGIAASMLRALASSPLINLALGLGVLSLHVGVTVLGGVIGRRARHAMERIS